MQQHKQNVLCNVNLNVILNVNVTLILRGIQACATLAAAGARALVRTRIRALILAPARALICVFVRALDGSWNSASTARLRHDLEQMRPQRQLARQIEAPARSRRQRCLKSRLIDRRNLQHRPRRHRFKDQLPRHPEMLREHRAKALVPLDKIAKRFLQSRTVEPARKPNRERDHIRAARLGTTRLDATANPRS